MTHNYIMIPYKTPQAGACTLPMPGYHKQNQFGSSQEVSWARLSQLISWRHISSFLVCFLSTVSRIKKNLFLFLVNTLYLIHKNCIEKDILHDKPTLDMSSWSKWMIWNSSYFTEQDSTTFWCTAWRSASLCFVRTWNIEFSVTWMTAWLIQIQPHRRL